MNYFSINNIAINFLGYPLSYIEIVATLTGIVSVWLAIRRNIWTWPVGIVNEAGFFLIFFQVQLYANMLLQIYFFIVTVYGWHFWRISGRAQTVTRSSKQFLKAVLIVLVIGFLTLGFFIKRIHLWVPVVFTGEADYPYLDSLTAVASMFAIWLMAQKRIEGWWLWIAVDILSVYLYLNRTIVLVALEYAVFLLLAIYGLCYWRSRLA